VKVYGAVPFAPVKVMFGDVAFLQTAIVPLIVAVGKGFTVTVAVPLCVCSQVVLLPSRTLNRVYANVPVEPVGTGSVILLLVPVVLIVWLPPALIR
jgi:hypothetical protein